ncbi:hypothetical protein ACFX13_022909 [Malus domestica]
MRQLLDQEFTEIEVKEALWSSLFFLPEVLGYYGRGRHCGDPVFALIWETTPKSELYLRHLEPETETTYGDGIFSVYQLGECPVQDYLEGSYKPLEAYYALDHFLEPECVRSRETNLR